MTNKTFQKIVTKINGCEKNIPWKTPLKFSKIQLQEKVLNNIIEDIMVANNFAVGMVFGFSE